MVARVVRDEEAEGSNPVTPTSIPAGNEAPATTGEGLCCWQYSSKYGKYSNTATNPRIHMATATLRAAVGPD